MTDEEARRVLRSGGEDVVEPWEERPEVAEAGVDDTTAPDPGGTEPRQS